MTRIEGHSYSGMLATTRIRIKEARKSRGFFIIFESLDGSTDFLKKAVRLEYDLTMVRIEGFGTSEILRRELALSVENVLAAVQRTKNRTLWLLHNVKFKFRLQNLKC